MSQSLPKWDGIPQDSIPLGKIVIPRVDRGTTPSLESNDLIYSNSDAATLRAQFSDLILDLEITTYFLEHYETKFKPK